jgi:hypothetical protein
MAVNYQGHRRGNQQSEAAAKPVWPPTRPISDKQKELWANLNAYCIERGGALTTRASMFPARLEVFRESLLPARLRELGWIVIDKGQETRLGPQILTHDSKGREKAKPECGPGYNFRVMDVYDIALPR